MAKKTIAQIALDVIKQSGTSMTPQQVYDKIIADGLYEFGARNPLAVLKNQIGRHTEGNTHAWAANPKYFRKLPDGAFETLE